MTFTGDLIAAFGAARVRERAPLAPLSTFRAGGPADWLVETGSAEGIVCALQIAHAACVPVTLLGGGSNILIGDRGIRGLVIRLRGGAIEQDDERHVRADAGVTINGLVRWTMNRGLAGLEAWAGTPGTVGGAIYGNAHYGGCLIGELVARVRLAARDGSARDVSGGALEFGYDRSRLQRTGEVLLWAVFRVAPGDPVVLRATARRSLAHRKETQPLDTPSAGCIFQNPDPVLDPLPAGVPTSAGALIDRAGLKGHRLGGARVSATHANFIVNEGDATARDIRALVELCQRTVFERFGIRLQEEVVCLGEF